MTDSCRLQASLAARVRKLEEAIPGLKQKLAPELDLRPEASFNRTGLLARVEVLEGAIDVLLTAQVCCTTCLDQEFRSDTFLWLTVRLVTSLSVWLHCFTSVLDYCLDDWKPAVSLLPVNLFQIWTDSDLIWCCLRLSKVSTLPHSMPSNLCRWKMLSSWWYCRRRNWLRQGLLLRIQRSSKASSAVHAAQSCKGRSGVWGLVMHLLIFTLLPYVVCTCTFSFSIKIARVVGCGQVWIC